MALYADELDELGLTDAEARHRLRSGTLWRRLVGQLLLALLLLPFAVVGATINVLPFLVVTAIGLLALHGFAGAGQSLLPGGDFPDGPGFLHGGQQPP